MPIGVGDFAPAELYDGFDAIAFLQKADGVVLFEIVIVVVRIRPEFQFLDLYDVLLLARIVLLLLEIVLVVAEIDCLSDRGHRGGCDRTKSSPRSCACARRLR